MTAKPQHNIVALVIILGACAIAAIAIPLMALKTPRVDQPQKPIAFASTQIPRSTPLPTPMPTPYWAIASYKIEREAIALKPGQFWTQSFVVKEEWRNARLVGRFTAQGGSGNDVKAFVTDDDGMVNFRNNHGYQVWYESGRATVDTIKAPLPLGKSYFVFDNTFSLFAHKSVTFDFRVEYQHLVQP